MESCKRKSMQWYALTFGITFEEAFVYSFDIFLINIQWFPTQLVPMSGPAQHPRNAAYPQGRVESCEMSDSDPALSRHAFKALKVREGEMCISADVYFEHNLKYHNEIPLCISCCLFG